MKGRVQREHRCRAAIYTRARAPLPGSVLQPCRFTAISFSSQIAFSLRCWCLSTSFRRVKLFCHVIKSLAQVSRRKTRACALGAGTQWVDTSPIAENSSQIHTCPHSNECKRIASAATLRGTAIELRTPALRVEHAHRRWMTMG